MGTSPHEQLQAGGNHPSHIFLPWIQVTWADCCARAQNTSNNSSALDHTLHSSQLPQLPTARGLAGKYTPLPQSEPDQSLQQGSHTSLALRCSCVVNCSAGKWVCSPPATLGAISEESPPRWEFSASFLSTEGCKEHSRIAQQPKPRAPRAFLQQSHPHAAETKELGGERRRMEGDAGALSPAAAPRRNSRGLPAPPPGPAGRTPAPKRGSPSPPRQPRGSLAPHGKRARLSSRAPGSPDTHCPLPQTDPAPAPLLPRPEPTHRAQSAQTVLSEGDLETRARHGLRAQLLQTSCTETPP